MENNIAKSPQDGSGAMKRVALVVGHSSRRKGAQNPNTKNTEYEYNKELIAEIQQKIAHEVDYDYPFETRIFYRKDSIGELIDRINKYDPVLAIEFHANSFNEKVSGCELVRPYEDDNMAAEGKVLTALISELLNNRDRGIKRIRPDERGGHYLYGVNAKYEFILEPFFIDNDQDLESATKNITALITGISIWILEFMKEKGSE